MRSFNISEFTFNGLSNHGKPLAVVRSIAYLVSLVDSKNHEIMVPKLAKNILNLVFVKEEQVSTPSDLLSWQKDCLPRGFYPQTPAMLAKEWSPVAAMLESGLIPLKLRRTRSFASVATGIWEPITIKRFRQIKECKTDQALFWAILSEAFNRAMERGLLVSIIAQPGWSYDTNIGSLNKWSEKRIIEADRILWKRTPKG